MEGFADLVELDREYHFDLDSVGFRVVAVETVECVEEVSFIAEGFLVEVVKVIFVLYCQV